MIATTNDPPGLEITDELNHVQLHSGQYYKLLGPPVPGHVEGTPVQRSGKHTMWVRLIGNCAHPFKASGEFYRATLMRLPWDIIVLGYDDSIDVYTLRMGDLKPGRIGVTNEN